MTGSVRLELTGPLLFSYRDFYTTPALLTVRMSVDGWALDSMSPPMGYIV